LQTTSAEAEVVITTRLSVAKNAFVIVTFSLHLAISTRPGPLPTGIAPLKRAGNDIGQLFVPDFPFTYSRAKKRTAVSAYVRGPRPDCVLDLDMQTLQDLVDQSGRELAAQIAVDILIIEDEIVIARGLEQLVENLGHRTERAAAEIVATIIARLAMASLIVYIFHSTCCFQ
jgi:hypothetical protein